MEFQLFALIVVIIAVSVVGSILFGIGFIRKMFRRYQMKKIENILNSKSKEVIEYKPREPQFVYWSKYFEEIVISKLPPLPNNFIEKSESNSWYYLGQL